MVWRLKEKTVSETPCSVSETERQEETVTEEEVGFNILKAETSFTKMGSQETIPKPTQIHSQPTATFTKTLSKEKDKPSGPATYGMKKSVALHNRFQLLGIQ
ncbi:hypothetical protein HID58_092287 [Brassica napus]|uniref:Uncharacterized protein n=1 Tax=Brassica napus TaxID=3708 RepID=A0ABQ7WZ88_BRANA|nr:hypothetical protein HID58_092287 [Brassica napus]